MEKRKKFLLYIIIILFCTTFLVFANVQYETSLLSSNKYGDIIDFYNGEGYLILLTQQSDTSVNFVLFKEVGIGFYRKKPIIEGQSSKKAYLYTTVTLKNGLFNVKNKNLLIEYGYSKIAYLVDVKFGNGMEWPLEYNNHSIFRVRDSESDPYLGGDERFKVVGYIVKTQKGKILEKTGTYCLTD